MGQDGLPTNRTNCTNKTTYASSPFVSFVICGQKQDYDRFLTGRAANAVTAKFSS